MNNPIPMILALAAGAWLISQAKSDPELSSNPESELPPTTLDYNSPELAEALEDADEAEEDEESDEE